MVEAKLEDGIDQISVWVEVCQTQGFGSPKWKATRSPGDILLSHCPISGNRGMDLDEEGGKLLLRIS